MSVPLPVGYYGAKVRLARRIVDLLPPHRVLVETHTGSAAVLFVKPSSPVEVINDLDDARGRRVQAARFLASPC
jgi:site-specific DNA-adenine methylase